MNKDKLKFRIVKSFGGDYYVQRRRWFGWQTQSGYHRGASGPYAYQFCTAANPYALIENTIPEIIKEFYQPTLPRSERRWFFWQRPPKLRKVVGVVDLNKATQMLREHQATNPPITKFIPPGEIPFMEG